MLTSAHSKEGAPVTHATLISLHARPLASLPQDAFVSLLVYQENRTVVKGLEDSTLFFSILLRFPEEVNNQPKRFRIKPHHISGAGHGLSLTLRTFTHKNVRCSQFTDEKKSGSETMRSHKPTN